MSNEFSRRDVIRSGSLIAVGLVAPPWLSAVARADVVRLATGRLIDPDTVLVVCQLSGGNDGLNTVVPFADELYRRNRPGLALPEDKILKLDGTTGLHPAMTGVHQLYQAGKVAIVQGVGYPNPNRSHFKSMEIWQSASPDGSLKNGWVGRAFDLMESQNPLSPVAGLGLSVEKPRALNANDASIPCFASLADIQSMVGDPDSERLLRAIQGKDAAEGSAARAVQQANRAALDAMSELKTRLATVSTKQKYGQDAFGKGFQQIAQLILASPKTRVVYFSAGGFDTHSRQAEQHEKLLQGFSDAVAAFQSEMEAAGKGDKVAVLVFSEFGRRTYENGSLGTDHGQAGPMFVIGSKVKGGMYGSKPDLKNLDDGDVKWTTDFRQVYSTALADWMGCDSGAVLGQDFKSLGLVR